MSKPERAPRRPTGRGELPVTTILTGTDGRDVLGATREIVSILGLRFDALERGLRAIEARKKRRKVRLELGR